MKKFLFSVVLVFLPALVFAYNPIIAEPDAVYEPILVEGDLYIEKNLLGKLEAAPDLYEFSSPVAFTFTVQVKQRDSGAPIPFGLLLVRQNESNGGVTEVLRQNVSPEDWQQIRYISLGMTFLEAPKIERNLTPGTYRIEVNTPDNYGPYMLVIGEETVYSGPLARFIHVFITQRHFDVFLPLAVLSPYVAIPTFLLVALLLWFKRKWDSVKL